MGVINYIIADDHNVFRKGLQLVLADSDELQCIGEAENGLMLLELLKTKMPDVVLLDLKMPGMGGAQVLKQIREDYPELKVIILTMQDNEHIILSLMEAGANGYIIKTATPNEVKTAIHTVVETGYYFSNHVSSLMLKTLVNKNKLGGDAKATGELTAKELEVLKLICKEYTTAEIGEKVFLSPRTVEGIRSTILEKLNVRNSIGLVIYAIKNGLYDE